MKEKDLEELIRYHTRIEKPLGDEIFMKKMEKKTGKDFALRPRGRPEKREENKNGMYPHFFPFLVGGTNMTYSKNKLRRVKPGRAPSFMGFIGSIIGVVFGILWSILMIYFFRKENELYSPGFYILLVFGIIFVIIVVVSAVYSYYAFKKRISVFDIVDSDSSEEGEHLDFNEIRRERLSGALNYCLYCSSSVEESFSFCPKCGKKFKEEMMKKYFYLVSISLFSFLFFSVSTYADKGSFSIYPVKLTQESQKAIILIILKKKY